jgi:hypothetical protein
VFIYVYVFVRTPVRVSVGMSLFRVLLPMCLCVILGKNLLCQCPYASLSPCLACNSTCVFAHVCRSVVWMALLPGTVPSTFQRLSAAHAGVCTRARTHFDTWHDTLDNNKEPGRRRLGVFEEIGVFAKTPNTQVQSSQTSSSTVSFQLLPAVSLFLH